MVLGVDRVADQVGQGAEVAKRQVSRSGGEDCSYSLIALIICDGVQIGENLNRHSRPAPRLDSPARAISLQVSGD